MFSIGKSSFRLSLIMAACATLTFLQPVRALPDKDAPTAPSSAQAAILNKVVSEQTAVLKKEPGNVTALSKRARAYVQLLKPDEALADCQKVLKAKPGDRDAGETAYGVYMVYLQNMEEENAIKGLDLCIGVYPTKGALYTRKAQLLQATGKAKEGIEAATKAIKLSPTDQNAYLIRGECLCTIGDQKAAIKDYSEITKLPKHRRDVYVRLANCYEAINDNKNALKVLNEVASMPNYDVADRLKIYLRRAQILQKSGDTNAALQDYARVINTPRPALMKIESSNQSNEQAMALQDRAQIYASQKKYDMAIKDYGSLIRQEQEWGESTPLYYLERAKLFRKIGKNNLADADQALAEKLQKKR